MKGIKVLFMAAVLLLLAKLSDSNENIPFVPGDTICDKCSCAGPSQGPNNPITIDCTARGFSNVLSNWPLEFDYGQENIVIASFSGNDLYWLRRLPELESYLLFSCRHCYLSSIESGVFVNTPNILRLDLSYNKLTADSLHSDIFRGQFDVQAYEPILLEELDLSHNDIWTLDGKAFEHLPNLKTLSLSNNHLTHLDGEVSFALKVLVNLEHLDLSHTGISELPDSLLLGKPHLRELLIYDNDLKAVPASLRHVGASLKSLYIGANDISALDATSFAGLDKLVHLNISLLSDLSLIADDTFSHLDALEVLFGSGNSKLSSFNITQLQNPSKLREIDFSYCNLSSLVYEPGDSKIPDPFPKMRSLKLENNPWNCNCDLYDTLRILEHYGSHQFQSDDDARCRSPPRWVGIPLVDFFNGPNCKQLENVQKRAPANDQPPFIRPRSIFLSLGAVLIVVAIGLLVGCGIVLVKKQWKKHDLGFAAPVRYSHVRNSLSSATTTTITA